MVSLQCLPLSSQSSNIFVLEIKIFFIFTVLIVTSLCRRKSRGGRSQRFGCWGTSCSLLYSIAVGRNQKFAEGGRIWELRCSTHCGWNRPFLNDANFIDHLFIDIWIFRMKWKDFFLYWFCLLFEPPWRTANCDGVTKLWWWSFNESKNTDLFIYYGYNICI